MSSMALRVYFTKGQPTKENVAEALRNISDAILQGNESGFISAGTGVNGKWKAHAIRKDKDMNL